MTAGQTDMTIFASLASELKIFVIRLLFPVNHESYRTYKTGQLREYIMRYLQSPHKKKM